MRSSRGIAIFPIDMIDHEPECPMPYRRFSIVSLLFTITLSLSMWAQTTVLTPQKLFDLRQVAEVALSPDGEMAAYTVAVPRGISDPPGADYRELYLRNLKTGETEGVVVGQYIAHSIRWTGDGRQVLFLANFTDSLGTQIQVVSREGGIPTMLLRIRKDILQFDLSPDRGTLAFVASDPPTAEKQALRNRGYRAEVYEEDQPDRELYTYTLNTRIMRRHTPGLSVFDFEWSPDSKRIAAAIAEKNTVDQSYMFKRIFLVDPSTEAAPRKLVDNPGKLGMMSWSPDSRYLAFVSAVDVHDPKEGSLFVVEPAAPKAFADLKNLSRGFAGTVTQVEWKDRSTLVFDAEEGVHTTLRIQPLDSKESALLFTAGEPNVGTFRIADSTIVFLGNTARHPNELFQFTFGKPAPTRLTTLNPWLEDIRLAKQETYEWKAKDGLTLQGVLIRPLDEVAGKRYPLIVDIHGGPESSYQNGWVTGYGNWGQIAAARGYAVFMPNYRASTGRGVDFAKMGFGDLAGKEFTDVLDGIDALVKEGLVEKSRVGIGGGSYGGYFAAWAATKHSERFAASVVFVGVSNQVSKRNTTDIPWEDYYVHWGIWTHENAEKVYDRSPVKWARNSKTPTLILHGKEDPRIHPSQALELYRSLKMHGKAPVRLVFYPGEGHGNRRTANRLDYAVRTMEWFDYYLKGTGPKDQMPAKDPALGLAP